MQNKQEQLQIKLNYNVYKVWQRVSFVIEIAPGTNNSDLLLNNWVFE